MNVYTFLQPAFFRPKITFILNGTTVVGNWRRFPRFYSDLVSNIFFELRRR